MSGVVVVAGVYPPGSVVDLIGVPDEAVLRPEGHDIVASRIVDEFGNVGFDGLSVGARFFCRGYVAGNYTLVRCRAIDAAAPDSQLIQPPIAPTPQNVGTQEQLAKEAAPHKPEGLETGVPEAAAAALSIVGQAPVKKEALYLCLSEEADPAGWALSGLQTPPTIASDGASIEPQPLWKPLEDIAAVGPGWQHYEGPTEPAPVSPEQGAPDASTTTGDGSPIESKAGDGPVGGAPGAQAPGAVTDEKPPAEPDVQGQKTVPSESAGVAEGAGSPSEQAAAGDPASGTEKTTPVA